MEATAMAPFLAIKTEPDVALQKLNFGDETLTAQPLGAILTNGKCCTEIVPIASHKSGDNGHPPA